MAKLTICKDCGETISKKAKSCPKCGAPNKNTSGCSKILLTIILLLTVPPLILIVTVSLSNNDSGFTSIEVFNKQQLNVRNGAGVDFKVIGVLDPGTLVSVKGNTSNGWYNIRVDGGFWEDSYEGWVNKKYVYSKSEFNIWKADYDKRISVEKAIANKNAWKTSDNKSMAYLMCEDWVKNRLKSPSSAEFPGVFDGKLENIIQTNQRYSIRSYVDSQNSFGAMLRTNFHCVTTQTSEGNWELNRLEIE